MGIPLTTNVLQCNETQGVVCGGGRVCVWGACVRGACVWGLKVKLIGTTCTQCTNNMYRICTQHVFTHQYTCPTPPPTSHLSLHTPHLTPKGWDAREEDMPQIVAIHNTVNERAWREVCRYMIVRVCCLPLFVLCLVNVVRDPWCCEL